MERSLGACRAALVADEYPVIISIPPVLLRSQRTEKLPY